MIYYNSWDKKCKSHFGAVVKGTEVSFTVYSDNCFEAYLCIEDKELKMDKNGHVFSISYKAEKLGPVFYCFRLTSNNLYTIYIGKGTRENSEFSLVCPALLHQLTVYEEMPDLPDWYTNGIMYQIFPDRFCKSGNIRQIKENCHIYDNWYEIPKYIKTEEGEIEKWDFFGGNFDGIREKLDYLKELNVSAIYLNPIFEATSNHRYNTADYTRVDPMLGTEEDFDRLITEAESKGIRIILDGVFNHVGAESIYFDRFDTFNSNGACQNENSPYSEWFYFKDFPTDYESWWGVMDLPKLNTENPKVREYICENVLKKWTKHGLGGWRLDVADELSDECLSLINKAVKDVNKDTVVIGEVWEDASNKVAYSVQKSYFSKPELDAVMNYPFRDNMVKFLLGGYDAFYLKSAFMTQLENYPKRNFMGNFNMLSTHDIARIFTVAGRDIKILEQFVSALFIFPGVPCIYYGDEAGLEGGKDPDNRRTFPWGRENKDIYNIYKRYSDLRNKSNTLKNGNTLFDAIDENIFCVVRFNEENKIILYLNNSFEEKNFVSPYTKESITVPPKGIYVEKN